MDFIVSQLGRKLRPDYGCGTHHVVLQGIDLPRGAIGLTLDISENGSKNQSCCDYRWAVDWR